MVRTAGLVVGERRAWGRRGLLGRTERRRGTALLVVMIVLLVLSSMAIVLLEQSRVSQIQSMALKRKNQADMVADAGVRMAILKLRQMPLITFPYRSYTPSYSLTDSAVLSYISAHGLTPVEVDSKKITMSTTASDTVYGGGEYYFELQNLGTVGTVTYLGLKVVARTQSGPSAYDWSEVNITLKKYIPEQAVPAPIMVDVGDGVKVPSFLSKTNSDPDKKGIVSGSDRDLAGVVDNSATKQTAWALTSATQIGTTSTPATLTEGTNNMFTGLNPPIRNDVGNLATGFRKAFETATATTSLSFSGNGEIAINGDEDGSNDGQLGTSTSPVVVKVTLGETGTLKLEGVKIYGALVVEVPENWTGTTAVSLNGSTRLVGVLYVKASALGEGTDDNGQDAFIRLNGSGNTTSLIGSAIVHVADLPDDYDASQRNLFRVNGGGTADDDVGFSTAAVNLASQALANLAEYDIVSYEVKR